MTGVVGPGAEDRALTERMMARVTHRGPDDTGHYLDAGCALGHTRLSIIDVAGGHEPILDADGQRAIVYNGEIYNHLALRAELETQGATFKTHTDAEVPLHLLGATDDTATALGRLEGMFAFAIWDSTTRRLLLARDPYGIKPLFWTQTDGRFLFASEMKALLADPDVPAALADEAVRQKGVFEYLLRGHTWLDGIHSVPPGHYLVTDGKDVQIRPYHTGLHEPVPADRTARAKRLDELLSESVESQMMSEVPLGVILSGGLDSSLIAAINRRHDPDREIQTFSVAESDDNEDFRRAREVAEALGTTHRTALFDREDLERDLAAVIWSNEDIDYETYFFYPLFRMMKRHATVGLCGQGADEVFGGYDRYKDIPGTVARLRERTAAAYPDATGHHDDIFKAHYRDLPTFLAWDKGAQLANFQLRLVDRNSMAFGTEIRVPFLDRRVVAFGEGLPQNAWIDDGIEKVALRDAAARTPLPRGIVDRPKIPAGRSTGLGVVESFEADVSRAYSDARVDAHPYGHVFRKKAELLALDLFQEIYIERRGAAPRELSWSHLV